MRLEAIEEEERRKEEEEKRRLKAEVEAARLKAMEEERKRKVAEDEITRLRALSAEYKRKEGSFVSLIDGVWKYGECYKEEARLKAVEEAKKQKEIEGMHPLTCLQIIFWVFTAEKERMLKEKEAEIARLEAVEKEQKQKEIEGMCALHEIYSLDWNTVFA